MADTVEMADLRSQQWERDVKGFALQNYRFKEACMITGTSAWTNSYYQETATELTGGTGSAVKGIPRLANFPNGEVSWTLKNAIIEKYGMEGTISFEDALTDNIDVIARTLLRIGRAVAKAVDDQIYVVLSENNTPSLINTVAISGGNEWDSATVANRDPIKDLLNAKQLMYEQNYDPDNGNLLIFMSPKDYRNVLSNSKVINNPTFKQADVVTNGRVGKLVGGTIIVSNSVTADKCLLCIAKECATWKAAVPLTVVTQYNPGISYTIRAFEMGVTQLTNPKAVCLITNTQA